MSQNYLAINRLPQMLATEFPRILLVSTTQHYLIGYPAFLDNLQIICSGMWDVQILLADVSCGGYVKASAALFLPFTHGFD